jgi:YD repeat-containing protein
MISKTVNTSDGQELISNTQYPLDFSNTTATDGFTLGIKNLDSMYAFSVPVEQYIQRSNADGSNLRTIASTLNSYNSILPFPNFQYKSRVAAPLTTFAPATTVSDGLVLDASYEQRYFIDSYDPVGNILQQHKMGDVPTSYQWGYNNEHPVVKVVNASNNYTVIYTPTYSIASGTFIFPPNTFAKQGQPLNIGASGNLTITLSWAGNPGLNNLSNVSYDLVGPIPKVGAIGSGNASSPLSISGLPIGNYTLYITPNINSSAANLIVTYTYPIVTQVPTGFTGAKEFFYDGFEENSSASVVQGTAHTGVNYWGGSTYTTTFTLPQNTTRQFIIQWWSLSGSSWVFHQAPYTGITTLNGPVDDIRIFPIDALMTTNTFQPLVGMTSSIDPAGHVIYYTYDALSRLMSIKDQYGNIVKEFDYKYQQP